MKLTSKRCNGIKSGYWSAAKKDDLTQKLGQIEDGSEKLISEICDGYCKFSAYLSYDALQDACETCPMNKLMEMIK